MVLLMLKSDLHSEQFKAKSIVGKLNYAIQKAIEGFDIDFGAFGN